MTTLLTASVLLAASILNAFGGEPSPKPALRIFRCIEPRGEVAEEIPAPRVAAKLNRLVDASERVRFDYFRIDLPDESWLITDGVTIRRIWIPIVTSPRTLWTYSAHVVNGAPRELRVGSRVKIQKSEGEKGVGVPLTPEIEALISELSQMRAKQ